MEKINVLIVEDSLIVAEGIAVKLKKHQMEIIGICESGEEAIAFIEKRLPDLIIMDIQLAGALDGISTSKLIKDKYEIPVIYLSDYVDDLTVQRASKTSPANYLAKPFNENDLVRAINIAFANSGKSNKVLHGILGHHIFIKDEDVHFKLAFGDIIYLKANGAYCNIVTEGKTFVQSISMNHVLEQINDQNFIRVHRSYVVNANKITKIQGNTVFLGKHEVVMSKSLRDELVGKLKYLK